MNTTSSGPWMPFPALMLHALPMWFLVLALFLPRIALLAAWLQGMLQPFPLDSLLGPVFALLLPRLLVLYLIYTDQGLSQWFLIHAVMALFVLLGFSQRRRIKRSRGLDTMQAARRRPALPRWVPGARPWRR